MSTKRISVDPTGVVRFVWDDALSGLCEHGRVSMRRVSKVEADDRGRWTADLDVVNGPTLGPFTKRGDAITAEVEWLNDRRRFPTIAR